jgi:sugar lactone lactonase YvrE
VWDEARARLVFVDILQRQVREFEPRQRVHRVLPVGRQVSAIVPTTNGDWLAAADSGFVRIDPDSGAVRQLLDVEPAGSRRRMNDGAVDPAGRFWAGSMSLDRVAGQGTLYRLDHDLTVVPVIGSVSTSNGPAWSPDGRLMYFVDTRTRRIDVLDFDVASGEPANRRAFVTFDAGPGRPDGVIVDRDGGVWVALWEGGAVHRYRPDGSLGAVVEMPTAYPTKCAFGGDDLGDLYITTARAPVVASGQTPDEHAGGLFVLRPGVCGQRTHLFGPQPST